MSVANEGPPLPAALADRVFESMTSARDEAHRGGAIPHLGLGLYIVRLVAEAHGGNAQAVNRTGMSGVIVTVTLPVA